MITALFLVAIGVGSAGLGGYLAIPILTKSETQSTTSPPTTKFYKCLSVDGKQTGCIVVGVPTLAPTLIPTTSTRPTSAPTNAPVSGPTPFPTTAGPTIYVPGPTSYPTSNAPTPFPTNRPITTPTTSSPTKMPTTQSPTPIPTSPTPPPPPPPTVDWISQFEQTKKARGLHEIVKPTVDIVDECPPSDMKLESYYVTTSWTGATSETCASMDCESVLSATECDTAASQLEKSTKTKWSGKTMGPGCVEDNNHKVRINTNDKKGPCTDDRNDFACVCKCSRQVPVSPCPVLQKNVFVPLKQRYWNDDQKNELKDTAFSETCAFHATCKKSDWELDNCAETGGEVVAYEEMVNLGKCRSACLKNEWCIGYNFVIDKGSINGCYLADAKHNSDLYKKQKNSQTTAELKTYKNPNYKQYRPWNLKNDMSRPYRPVIFTVHGGGFSQYGIIGRPYMEMIHKLLVREGFAVFELGYQVFCPNTEIYDFLSNKRCDGANAVGNAAAQIAHQIELIKADTSYEFNRNAVGLFGISAGGFTILEMARLELSDVQAIVQFSGGTYETSYSSTVPTLSYHGELDNTVPLIRFNDEGQSQGRKNLPRLASDTLGHKTYMNTERSFSELPLQSLTIVPGSDHVEAGWLGNSEGKVYTELIEFFKTKL